MVQDMPGLVGGLIRDARSHRNLTQAQLAELLGTSQSAVARMEQGKQNLTLDTIEKVALALDSDLVSIPSSGGQNLRITGGQPLSGEITVRTSKNAAVALLCGSLLNKGRTVLRSLARIEEVYRLIEVLTSIGVQVTWLDDSNDLEIVRPKELRLADMDEKAAARTRTVISFLGPLLHDHDSFRIPFAGGCDLGKRTVEPHLSALRRFGLEVDATSHAYEATVDHDVRPTRPIVLTERGDVLTNNVLLAAARHEGETIIRNASPNYMVQDLCFFLQKLGVEIDGVGTTTLRVRGVQEIDVDVEYCPSEDPIEAMSLLAAAVVTKSEITIRRVPIEFMEMELATLELMGMEYGITPEYMSANGRTRLVDLTTVPGELRAPRDKIHPMPFPGINIDNLPFLAIIAACAQGRTLVHDWVYENRAIYLTELTKIGARVDLMDPHRVMIEGPTRWRPAEMMTPPALRPSMVILIGMLAAPGTSILRNVYVINRGYEDAYERLNALGAQIETFRDA